MQVGKIELKIALYIGEVDTFISVNDSPIHPPPAFEEQTDPYLLHLIFPYHT